jgi:hypothetical protein
MKILRFALPVMGLASAALYLGLATSSMASFTPVSDEVAANIRGGGCGNTWVGKTLGCNATIVCNNVATACSSIVVGLFTNGAGNQVAATTGLVSCRACAPTKSCGPVMSYITGTNPCITTTTSITP